MGWSGGCWRRLGVGGYGGVVRWPTVTFGGWWVWRSGEVAYCEGAELHSSGALERCFIAISDFLINLQSLLRSFSNADCCQVWICRPHLQNGSERWPASMGRGQSVGRRACRRSPLPPRCRCGSGLKAEEDKQSTGNKAMRANRFSSYGTDRSRGLFQPLQATL